MVLPQDDGHLRMSERAAGEGTPISSSRSKRPGRLRAGSSASGLLLAAMTTTPATHAVMGVLTKILYLHVHVCAKHAAIGGVVTQVLYLHVHIYATPAALSALTQILYLHVHVYATHAAMGVLTKILYLHVYATSLRTQSQYSPYFLISEKHF